VTIPRGMQGTVQKVSDLVRHMVPRLRETLSEEERAVAIHLRGNEHLYSGLKGLVQARIDGRASVAEPSDPLTCKSMLARDRELQWLLSRLAFVYRSPVVEATPENESELPG